MIKPGISLAAAILLSACASSSVVNRATAQLAPTTGNSAAGTVTFTQRGNAVLVAGEVRGLAPNKEHGFHVHDKGDCSGGDGMATGGHFNPTGSAHGAHDNAQHHAGDLVSLKADGSGVARFSYTSNSITVGHGIANVIGRGLIVHRDPDDFKTQPTGNSGPRIACAVVTLG